MKISKALLGAMLAGIATQTVVTSCTHKDKTDMRPQKETNAQPGTNQQPDTASNPGPSHDSCPACGMG